MVNLIDRWWLCLCQKSSKLTVYFQGNGLVRIKIVYPKIVPKLILKTQNIHPPDFSRITGIRRLYHMYYMFRTIRSRLFDTSILGSSRVCNKQISKIRGKILQQFWPKIVFIGRMDATKRLRYFIFCFVFFFAGKFYQKSIFGQCHNDSSIEWIEEQTRNVKYIEYFQHNKVLDSWLWPKNLLSRYNLKVTPSKSRYNLTLLNQDTDK